MQEIIFSGKRVRLGKNLVLIENGISIWSVIIYLIMILVVGPVVFSYIMNIIGIAVMTFFTLNLLRESVKIVTNIESNIMNQCHSFLSFSFGRKKRSFENITLLLERTLSGGGDGTHTMVYYCLFGQLQPSEERVKLLKLQRRKDARRLADFFNIHNCDVKIDLDKDAL